MPPKTKQGNDSLKKPQTCCITFLFSLLKKSISLYDIIQEFDQRKNKSAKGKNA
jgi:hypothetical protein